MSQISGFDRIARPYRVLEYLTLGSLLERTRLYFLPCLLTARKALVLGDGDGRFLSHLLAVNSGVHSTAIDISGQMLRLLRRRCAPYANRLETQQKSALDFSPPPGTCYDLVVTHFFLDCLTQAELEELILHLVPALAPHSQWIVSDFRIPAGTMRLPAQILVRSLYLAFRILSGLRTNRIPDYASALQAVGFRRVEEKLLMAGILTTERWQREIAASTSY